MTTDRMKDRRRLCGVARTLSTRALLARLFNSTTPSIVSPKRYADFAKVSTATLTPSLFTSYETAGTAMISQGHPEDHESRKQETEGMTTAYGQCKFPALARGANPPIRTHGSCPEAKEPREAIGLSTQGQILRSTHVSLGSASGSQQPPDS